MLGLLFIVFVVCMGFGIPIAFSMGIASFIALIVGNPEALIAMPARVFGGLDSFPLMAVPLFILAGKLMEVGGVSKRLVDFAELLVGVFKGGLAMAAVVASVIFAGISGSATADTTAIGSILIPSMVKKGYEKGFVSCLIATGGTIGPVIPPSLLMIIYSSATGLSVGTLFLAGFLPGIVMALSLMVIAYLYAKKHPELADLSEKRSFKESIQITKQAIGALMMPVIIIGGIVTGIFTATEAAAVSVIYAFVIGVFVYKELPIKDSWRLLAEAAKDSAGLMLIVSMATLMGWILAKEQFPKIAASLLTSFSSNPAVIMLLVIIFLLIVGCFVETIAALVILVPVLHAISVQFAFNPIHFAMVVVITLLIGAVTPPVGVLLYISSAITKISYGESLKYITPFIVALITVTLLVAYIPQITLLIPSLFMK